MLPAQGYDFLEETYIPEENGLPHEFKKAKLSVDTIVDSELEENIVDGVCMNPATLHPTYGGNIHEFRALSHCVVLDVLSPPYAPGKGRDCTYYKVHEVNARDIGTTQNVFVDVVTEEEEKQNVELYLSACPEPSSFICTQFHGYVAPNVKLV